MKKLIYILIYKLFKLLNNFCFSDKHDDNCNGCIFKKFHKCPLAYTEDNIILKVLLYLS